MISSQSTGFEAANVNRSGPWTASEDARLIQVVSKYGARSWDKLATKIPGRSGKSCRLRWSNQLSPDLNRAPFSDWEDAVVIRGHEELGKKWAKISKLLVGRTDNAVKNRWNGLFCRGLESVTKKNIYLSSRATLRAILNAGPTCNHPVRWQQRRDDEQQAGLKSESCQSHETYQPRVRHRQQGRCKRNLISGCSARNNTTGGPDDASADDDSSVNSFASFKQASLPTYEDPTIAPRRPNKEKNYVAFISTNDDDQHAGSHHHGAQHEDMGMNEEGNDGVLPDFQNTISDENAIYNQQAAMMIHFDRQQHQQPKHFNHYGTSICQHHTDPFHAFPSLTKSHASERDELPSAEGLRSGFIGEKHGWIDATPFSSDLDNQIRELFIGAECSNR